MWSRNHLARVQQSPLRARPDRGAAEVERALLEEGLSPALFELRLERLRDEPRLVVRAADQDLAALRLHLDGCVQRSGFDGA